MTTIEVFDPAMCCTTGVCGPTVEPGLARFEADLRWLATRGATVTRHNLAQEPGAFATHTVVSAVLTAGGEQALPVILVDGRLRWTGLYPGRDELAALLGGDQAASVGSQPGPGLLPIADTGGGCCPPAGAAGADGTSTGGCC